MARDKADREIAAAMAAKLGIVVVAEDAVPAATRTMDRDTARWDFLVEFLVEDSPNVWVAAKSGLKPQSAQVLCSNINNDRNKKFLGSAWSARYSKPDTEKGETTSTLYLKYTPAS